MPRKTKTIIVDLLPVEIVSSEQPCPWIRATEVLIRAAERLGLPLVPNDTNFNNFEDDFATSAIRDSVEA